MAYPVAEADQALASLARAFNTEELGLPVTTGAHDRSVLVLLPLKEVENMPMGYGSAAFDALENRARELAGVAALERVSIGTDIAAAPEAVLRIYLHPSEDETLEIGYREDGAVWVTASSSMPTAAAAEQHIGAGWKVVEAVWMRPTGEWVDRESQGWMTGSRDDLGARSGWRLINTRQPELLNDEDGELYPNPHFDPAR